MLPRPVPTRWHAMGIVTFSSASLRPAIGVGCISEMSRVVEQKFGLSSSNPCLSNLNTRHAMEFCIAAPGNVTQHLMIAGTEGTSNITVAESVTPMETLQEIMNEISHRIRKTFK